ncbi:DUF6801 domain-containing protein [Streptomyces sp. NPDC002476]|uniref:DUF6801 domain-containing protein n=1 Tax=Streptomyces sp. NPDC002476 TaxID=3364648 RepID=UPI00369F6BF2
MSTRYTRSRMRIFLGAVTALAAATGMVSAVGAGTASARQLARTFGYTCSLVGPGVQSFTVDVSANVPDQVVAGRPGTTIAVNAVAKVNAGVTQWLANSGMSTIEGTVDASAHVSAPKQQVDIAVPFRLAKTTAPASGPFTVRATASVTTPTFNHQGRGTVTTGDFTLHIVAKNAAGMWLRSDGQCTLDSGQSNVVTSFDITAASSKPSTPPNPPTGSAGSSHPKPTTGSAGSTNPKHTAGSVIPTAPNQKTGSVAADAPKAATPKDAGPATEHAATPGSPSSQPSSATVADPVREKPRPVEPAIVGKHRATGLEMRDLIWPAVGVLLACVAAFYLGTRMRNRRRISGDGEVQPPRDPKPGLLIAAARDEGPDADHHKKLHAAVRRPRGQGCGNASRGNMARGVTEGQNLLWGRHVPHQADHQTLGTRARGGTDVPKDEDVNAVIHEEPWRKPTTTAKARP